MPRSDNLKPFWQTTDGEAVRLYLGNVEDVLRRLPEQSVQCCMTSPPYWGLRKYAVAEDQKHHEIGSEPSPDCGTSGQAQCGRCFVCRMVAVFRGVRRVLRDDGVLWLNLGDSYASGNTGGNIGGSIRPAGYTGDRHRMLDNPLRSPLPPGNLVGVPWRVALALQADGWVLRQDVVWCLSGGCWLYVRSQKGDMPMMVRDVARLDPSTVKLWNGSKWTQLLGMSCSSRGGDEVEIVLRSGERISCTPNHKFPTSRGLVESGSLKPGDVLKSCRLPEPDHPKSARHVSNDAAWFAGLYLAEGCGVKNGKIQIAGHSHETERWERVKSVVESYGGYCTLTVNGNNQLIRVYGKVICAILRELVSGDDARNKGFSPAVWQHGNDFLECYLDGYLSGDGHDDPNNPRWRLGFTRNYNLERDLRTACSRLGWTLTLNPSFAECDGRKFPTFRGEIRKSRSGHWNEKDRREVVEIRKSRCREVYDLGVADDPHLFALASGVLTHNSKPSPMPESVKNRCTKAHEYVFLLAKGPGYFYDADAIREKGIEGSEARYASQFHTGPKETSGAGRPTNARNTGGYNPYTGTRNKRSVWSIASEGFPGAHFATFPRKLVEPCLLAGTSAKGACARCGAPWRRLTEIRPLKRERPNAYVKRTGAEGTGNSCANDVAGVETVTTGWQPTCECFGKFVKRKGQRLGYGSYHDHDADVVEHGLRQGGAGPAINPGMPTKVLSCTVTEYVSDLPLEDHPVRPCVVLDPFVGAATTAIVAVEHGRRCWGIDLSEQYLRECAVPRIEEELWSRPSTYHLAGKEKTCGTPPEVQRVSF